MVRVTQIRFGKYFFVAFTEQEVDHTLPSLLIVATLNESSLIVSMENILIRPAANSEQKQLEALQLRASLNNAGDRDALLAHPDAIQLPLAQIAAGGVFVAESNGAIVGFATIEPRPDGQSELDALFVDPDMQRHGIGRSLVARCAEIAKSRSCTSLYVIGNPHAEKFYRVCGFEQIATTETRFGPGLVMRLPL
jgi:N-acetylglutamate synthase-like GNAT family acetyltransferase